MTSGNPSEEDPTIYAVADVGDTILRASTTLSEPPQ